MVKRISKANILDVSITQNKKGDQFEYVSLSFEDQGMTSWEIIIEDGHFIDGSFEDPRSVEIIFKGKSEKDCIVEALEFFLKELKKKK